MGAALDVRQIASAERLSANVAGVIEEVDGVLRITRIQLTFHLTIPPGTREKVDRALESYAEKCPAYQSVRACIDVSWDAQITEEGA